ncbi:MAG: hypothetical protein J1F63_08280 [Oscillospiraceae bacterium]|nr:hypothetical protein [Oscillospiraceae bacterium]
MKKKRLLALLVAAIMLFGVMPLSALAASPIRVKFNALSDAPRFDGWGTSLCWWAEVLGGEEEAHRKVISRALFDVEEGLGLNIVRYNIGAGDNPEHTHLNNGRGMPVWVDENGNFNPDADPNQIAFLQDAVEMGADIVEVFSNSPPYYMTVSGCSSGGEDSNVNNITPDKFDEFADYLATVTAYIQNDLGIKVDSLEPMNEANTNFWGYEGSQEGCHIDAEDHSALIVASAKALKAHGLDNVIVTASDENNMDVMAGYLDKYTDEALALMPRLNVHSYGGGYGNITRVAKELGKDIYMSEVDGDGSIGYDSENMGPALWFSQKIADDMNNLRPSAWVCWQVADYHRPGSNPDNGYWNLSGYDPGTNTLHKYKKYYAFAHYTKFIRPGFTFLGSAKPNVVAARDYETGETVIVVTNSGKRDETYEFDLSALDGVGSEVEAYATNRILDLAQFNSLASMDGKVLRLRADKDTIVTVVIKNETPAAVSNTSLTLGAKATSAFPGESIALITETNGAYPVYEVEGGATDGASITVGDGTSASVKAVIPETDISATLNIDIIHNGDTVRIVNFESGLAVQERGDGYVQEGDNDSAGQYWIINRIGDIASFINLRSGNMLADDGGTEWRITPGDGGWGLVNTKTERGLDDYGHAKHEGATVGTYEYGGGPNQLWNFSHGNLVPAIDELEEAQFEKRVIPVEIDGTAPYGGAEEVSYEKVFDGDLETHHDAWDGENSYVVATMPEGVKVNKVRFAPRIGFLYRMYGGTFYGVKGDTETLIYTVPETIRNGWNEFYFASDEAYDKIVYRTPAGGLCNIAELEFYTAPIEARVQLSEISDKNFASVGYVNYGVSAELQIMKVYRNDRQIKAVDIATHEMERYSMGREYIPLREGFESVDIYVLFDGEVVTSGYVYLAEKQ